jgi:hypothetical protein
MNDGPRTFPHYINEDKSDMLGIKSGWYAIDEGGNLIFGPFDTYNECVERDIRPTYLMLGPSLRRENLLKQAGPPAIGPREDILP